MNKGVPFLRQSKNFLDRCQQILGFVFSNVPPEYTGPRMRLFIAMHRADGIKGVCMSL